MKVAKMLAHFEATAKDRPAAIEYAKRHIEDDDFYQIVRVLGASVELATGLERTFPTLANVVWLGLYQYAELAQSRILAEAKKADSLMEPD